MLNRPTTMDKGGIDVIEEIEVTKELNMVRIRMPVSWSRNGVARYYQVTDEKRMMPLRVAFWADNKNWFFEEEIRENYELAVANWDDMTVSRVGADCLWNDYDSCERPKRVEHGCDGYLIAVGNRLWKCTWCETEWTVTEDDSLVQQGAPLEGGVPA